MSAVTDNEVTSDFRLLSKKQVASLLGYTTRTVDRLVHARRIPFTYLPTASGKENKVRFIESEIRAWINSGRVVTVDREAI